MWLLGCAVKVPVTHVYQLTAFAAQKKALHPHKTTLLLTAPEAVAGFETEQMLYMKKPYQIAPFAKNAWVSPPADMLFALLTQSIQSTGYFHAVVTSPYNLGADYRLDTQLLMLKQNFLKKPSVLEFAAKSVLTRIKDNQVLASQVVHIDVPAVNDTPYGGVIAANEAVRQFTARTARFVLINIR
jgi:cholesterol transport system auxiliary component